MAIYISVISHQHNRDIIDGLQPHTFSAQPNITVVIKDNIPSPEMETYCKRHGIDYIANNKPQGFGHNNNDIYLYCRIKHRMKDDDLFIVLNPDVIADACIFHQLDAAMQEQNVRLAAPNLYRDEQMKVLEGSIRRYPMPWDFAASFLFKSQRTTIKRHHIQHPTQVEWASGAFLAFRACLYKQLSGFDPRYYLYCEDVDICWRARVLFNEPTMYLPHIRAVHKGHRASHSVLSHYIRWHITSAVKFSARYLPWVLFNKKPKCQRVLQ